MSSKKWASKRITVNLAREEECKLEDYCQLTGRPATDVIRELIRLLPVGSNLTMTVFGNVTIPTKNLDFPSKNKPL